MVLTMGGYLMKLGLSQQLVKIIRSLTLGSNKSEGEVRECILRARVVGKWLSNSGTTETIMGLFGVKP